ncbi:hypothetical protein ACSV5M_21490 [Cellvibrio sp. ARAG 10.3]|uniref:hypothetical protein n=1 Tax=Cellvibrio sp. ARAG 10.3 TaxID=3451358 RepID=UPI003F45E408
MRPLTLARRQGGYLQITAAVALIVFGTLMAIQTREMVNKSRSDSAEMAGVLAAQFKHALRAMIAERGTGAPTGTFTGVSWLKRSGSCAGATGSAAYLPCEFPQHLPLGLSYRTVVSVSSSTVTASVQLGAPSASGEVWPHLAGIIVTAINGASNDYVTPATQTYHVASHHLTSGAIAMTVSNAPENLEFLKKDGTVRPTGNFNWNNFSITNVRNLQANGTLSVSGTGSFGSTVTAPTVNATNMTATGTLSGQTITGTNVNVNGNLRIVPARSVGGACSTGSIGRTSTGNILSCVSGTWREVGGGGSTVITGFLANGATVPIPQGFTASQCTISVANATNYHGQRPNYFAGARASVDGNRRVMCGIYDDFTFHARGLCAYTVACNETPVSTTTGPIAGDTYANTFMHPTGTFSGVPSGYTSGECSVAATSYQGSVSRNGSNWYLSCSAPPQYPQAPSLCPYSLSCVKV